MGGVLRVWSSAVVFRVPAGPILSGCPPVKKRTVREPTRRKPSREELLQAEEESPTIAPGPALFYGRQTPTKILLEAMGLQLPGASFVHPIPPLREALTGACSRRTGGSPGGGVAPKPGQGAWRLSSPEKALIKRNWCTAGHRRSTNLTIASGAIGMCAGLQLHLEDMDALSSSTGLIARMFQTARRTINQFYQRGGHRMAVPPTAEAGLLQ